MTSSPKSLQTIPPPLLYLRFIFFIPTRGEERKGEEQGVRGEERSGEERRERESEREKLGESGRKTVVK